MKKITLSLATFLSIFFAACSSDDDNTVNPVGSTITAPATYSFNRGGENTVSYGGQTTRIAMASQTASAIKDNSKTQTQLDAMFAHVEGANDFEDVPGLDLNGSSKSVRSKTAASIDYFSSNTTSSNALKADFDGYLEGQVQDVFPNWETTASSGNSGQLQENGGGSTRYINAKGLEYNQAFAKGLIGSLMTDQILNSYLSSAVLDEGDNRENNNNDVLDEGKDYTTMEHKWDEAYGYVYGLNADAADPNADLGADSFLNKYILRVEGDDDFAGIADEIFQAFKLGRAAIVAKQYDVRNAQADIIRLKVSEIIGIRSVYYLQTAKSSIDQESPDFGGAFHDISEGYGFIYSLQFTRKPNSTDPYFTKAEVDAFLVDLMDDGPNGLWDVELSTLENMATAIAVRFEFTLEAASE